MRQAGGRQFADVVIGVSPGAAVGQGHAAADAVEAAVERGAARGRRRRPRRAAQEGDLRERAHAAAIAVPASARCTTSRSSTSTAGPSSRCTSSCPGDAAARGGARDRRAARGGDPRGRARDRRASRRTSSRSPRCRAGREVEADGAAVVTRVVRNATGADPRELRFLRTDAGLVAFLTLGLAGATTPRRGARTRERDRGADPTRAARHRRRDRSHRALTVRLRS